LSTEIVILNGPSVIFGCLVTTFYNIPSQQNPICP